MSKPTGLKLVDPAAALISPNGETSTGILDQAARLAGISSPTKRREFERLAWLLRDRVIQKIAMLPPSIRETRKFLSTALMHAQHLHVALLAGIEDDGARSPGIEAWAMASWETATRMAPDRPEAFLQTGRARRLWRKRRLAVQGAVVDLEAALKAFPQPSTEGHGGNRPDSEDIARAFTLAAIAELYYSVTGKPPSAGGGNPTRFQRFYAAIIEALDLPAVGQTALRHHVTSLLGPAASPHIGCPTGWLEKARWIEMQRLRKSRRKLA